MNVDDTMMEQPPLATPPSLADALGHALMLTCPNCGKAKLFARYLKQVDICPNCVVKWADYPADDGPAWCTILVVGHIMASIAVTAAIKTDWDVWKITTALAIASILLSLAMLPFAKAIFVAVIWKTGAGKVAKPEN